MGGEWIEVNGAFFGDHFIRGEPGGEESCDQKNISKGFHRLPIID